MEPVVTRIHELGRRAHVLPANQADRDTLDAAGLVIATISPYQVPGQGTIGSWARLLRPSGVLAALTHTSHNRGRLVDPTGAIVTAAQDADLLYLQHIVALPTGAGDTATATRPHHPADSRNHPRRADIHAGGRHGRVHADLLIFLHTSATTEKSTPGGPR